jgi:hypothetical protein
VPRRDTYHQIVRDSLQKDEWQITHDPFPLRLGDIPMGIDLGAEKLLAAERGQRKIAVEIKSFATASDVATFHTALGQFLNYQFALDQTEPDRKLYLAIPQHTHETFFRKNAIAQICSKYEISFLVYSVEREEVVSWID